MRMAQDDATAADGGTLILVASAVAVAVAVHDDAFVGVVVVAKYKR